MRSRALERGQSARSSPLQDEEPGLQRAYDGVLMAPMPNLENGEVSGYQARLQGFEKRGEVDTIEGGGLGRLLVRGWSKTNWISSRYGWA